ncbi:site-specific integrase [Anaeromyxobacter sp. PSR-1]|uniref:tyrosine-type recombinase/integrase n=1 Tax=Anaeromyxobacter sp. PSR-1 TaxID=1300915 RepID=UPI0005DD94F1|nr:site-specific integrase [Anaeromyxobacter sp. PSR-1]GAO01833.1 putative prophage CPZ-55 integrase [Anaeromyxobacter sp. PSR-1]
MPSIRLTAVAVEKLATPATGRLEVYDAEVPGLVLRVSASGVKSWSFTYRVKGDPRRLTLGAFPGVTLKLARERARDARAAVQRGEDPVSDRKEAEREQALNGFTACKKDFIEKYAKPKNKTWKETERVLDRLAVPVWGDRPVKEIRRRDVVELIEDVASDTPFQANQLRLHLSKMFSWLLVREVVDANPVTGIPPPVDLHPRERILSDAELVALWKATLRLGFPFGPATRFLLLTGVRRNEAGFLRWDELDGNWAAMPGSRMKNGRDFRAPLSAAAKAIVDSMPKLGVYVFTTNGKTPISGWGKAKERLDKLMSEELRERVAEWRFHDLRRTMATGVAMLGYRREVIDRILAHVPQKSDVTSSVYNRFMYDAEAMEAVQKWAAHVARLTTGLEVVQTADASV